MSIRITQLSPNMSPDAFERAFNSVCPPTPRGEMAQEAYHRAEVETEMLAAYHNGDYSLEDAYELGIVDETGTLL